MKTLGTSPTVQSFLITVEREASALPAARRQELVADLAEHVEVALSQRPGQEEAVLAELGDPRTIAATALHELGEGSGSSAEEHRTRSPAWLPLVLLLVGTVLPWLGDSAALSWISTAVTATAVVMVCRSRHWKRADKWTGLALAVIVPVFARVVWYAAVVAPDSSVYSSGLRWTVTAVLFAVLLVGAGRLWRTRRTPDHG